MLFVGQLIEPVSVAVFAVRFRPFSCDPSVVTGCRLPADENRSVEGRFGVAPFVAGALRNGLVDDCGRVLGMTFV